MAKKESRTILVTGATGHQGGTALRHLREKGFTVRALTRDPTKDAARQLVGPRTEVMGGDLNDKASVARALDGVQGVYSVQSSVEQGVEGEVREGILLADEAKLHRVTTHLLYGKLARNAGSDQSGDPRSSIGSGHAATNDLGGRHWRFCRNGV